MHRWERQRERKREGVREEGWFLSVVCVGTKKTRGNMPASTVALGEELTPTIIHSATALLI